jgi:YebC/PmpR family DNA-binding regulatory protein
MGRIFEKRKERMFARWSKNAKAFTKLGKEIAIAVKASGPDPAGNPRLRAAIQTARSLNMPKDRIEAAIKRVNEKDTENYQELKYDGYGPHGVAVVVETATDNQTRTVANIRSTFGRWGGVMATSGALDYIFDHKGVFIVDKPEGDLDQLELDLIDHNLEDLFETESGLLMYSSFTEFNALQKGIEAHGLVIQSAGLQRVPKTFTTITAEQEVELDKLVSMLEEDDDVQHVYHNARLAE